MTEWCGVFHSKRLYTCPIRYLTTGAIHLYIYIILRYSWIHIQTRALCSSIRTPRQTLPRRCPSSHNLARHSLWSSPPPSPSPRTSHATATAPKLIMTYNNHVLLLLLHHHHHHRYLHFHLYHLHVHLRRKQYLEGKKHTNKRKWKWY